MDELCYRDGEEYEWKETARWLKFEEDVEDGGDRWSKPYVATLSLHSLFELRSCILNGTVMLDMRASTLDEIADMVLDNMIASGQLDDSIRENVREALLKRHHHQNEKRFTSRIPLVRSFADIGKKHSDPHLLERNGILASPQSAPGNLDNSKSGEMKGNGSGGSRENSTVDFSKVDMNFMRKIPTGAEASNVLVGEVDFLERPIIAFVRLAPAVLLSGLTEVPVPTRFLFLLLGPAGKASQYHEIGRSIATLMTDEIFHDVAYKAKDRNDLLSGIDEFLDQVTVLPPGEWDPSIRIEPPKSVPSQECKAFHGMFVGSACGPHGPYVPDVLFWCVVLFFTTFFLSSFLKQFKTKRYFPTKVRSTISDFAVFLTIVIMVAIDYLVGIPSPKLNVPEKFEKGAGYHLDLLMVGVMLGVCSIMGLPWFVAATVLSISHVNSLKVESECSAPGEQPKFLGIREQRVTGLMIFILMGLSVFMTSVLKFFDRIKLFGMPAKHQPDLIYLRYVPLWKVHVFTVIQLTCLVLLWVIKASAAAVVFPMMEAERMLQDDGDTVHLPFERGSLLKYSINYKNERNFSKHPQHQLFQEIFTALYMETVANEYLGYAEEQHCVDKLVNMTNIFQKLAAVKDQREWVTASGAHKTLVNLLGARDTNVLLGTLLALASLAESPECREKISELNIVENLLMILHEYDLLSKRLTAELLRLLCAEPQVKEQVKLYEGIPILLSLLHSDHLKLLWSVVWILVQVCEDPETSVEIRIWGGIKQLLHILRGDRNFVSDRSSIGSLSSANAAGRIQQLHLSEDLSPGEIQENTVSLQAACCAALTELALNDANAHQVVQCYAFRALRFLFSMERNRPLFKRLFPTDLFEIFIDIGHYVRDISAYEDLVSQLNLLLEDELKQIAENIESINQKKAPLKYIGDYAVLDHLGSGAFGCVYKVRKRSGQNLLAMKEVNLHNPAFGKDKKDRDSSVKNIVSELTIIKEQATKFLHAYLPSVAKATGCSWLAALKQQMFAVSEIPAVNTFFVSMVLLEASAGIAVSQRKVRQISDPIQQILIQLHKVIYITQLPPALHHDLKRRVIERFKKSLFSQQSNPCNLKSEIKKTVIEEVLEESGYYNFATNR
ncbi:Serine/threonine-protein kinase Nek10 [Cricetulus griseus]|uniref:Serine/threonine-protein kinase Nek10 n=1 Tax=Cricetulus griseus TaxID=10029 RepID=G3H4L4_CRIGR|nr:Serine/threonine-protein kinase Nek10 [Cricetulus griseus]